MLSFLLLLVLAADAHLDIAGEEVILPRSDGIGFAIHRGFTAADNGHKVYAGGQNPSLNWKILPGIPGFFDDGLSAGQCILCHKNLAMAFTLPARISLLIL